MDDSINTYLKIINDTFFWRALCIDAIMDIADKNHDWRLDYTEFQNCMDPNFIAEEKRNYKFISHFNVVRAWTL